MSQKKYYPIFADIKDRLCIVIGAGSVAERKIASLLKAGARVVVVSPSATEKIKAWSQRKKLEYRHRKFRTNDLKGAWLVFAATDDARVNRLVSKHAKKLRVFANISDAPLDCSFIVPSTIRKEGLVAAFSSSGKSPLFLKRFRRKLETSMARHAKALKLMADIRKDAMSSILNKKDRKKYLDRLMNRPLFRI
jgi:precorrin-2 dehydrogenase/sirohydrochlorin ferrochelatase